MARVLLVWGAFCISIALALAAPPVIEVRNLKLFVDGEEYIVTGFNYQPTPIGYATRRGLCSYRATPWLNGSQSACYDSDYFDGSLTPSRTPTPGPQRGWFREIWERDLPKMKAMGVNTIRLFNVNPTTLQATVTVVNTQPGLYNITSPYGKEHLNFLDYADSLGLKVIFPLFGDASALRTYPDDQYQWLLRQQINEVGNHPAVLMFAFGNEYVLQSDWRTLFNRSSQLMRYAKDYQWTRWGRRIPFLTALLDRDTTVRTICDRVAHYLQYKEALRYYGDVVDIMGLNAGYRFANCPHPNCAYSFTNLWSGSTAFVGWYNASCTTGIPTLITEFNPQGYKNIDPSIVITTGFSMMWADILNHVNNGAIGGLYFEWSDEPQKGDQTHLGVMMTSVACSGTQCSNMTDVWIPDDITPRQWVYDALTTTVWNGKPYNWKTDPFAVLGRPQATIDNPPWICPGPAPTTVPPTTPPRTTTPISSPPASPSLSPSPSPSLSLLPSPSPSPSVTALPLPPPSASVVQTLAVSPSPTPTYLSTPPETPTSPARTAIVSPTHAPDIAASTASPNLLPQVLIIALFGAFILVL